MLRVKKGLCIIAPRPGGGLPVLTHEYGNPMFLARFN